MRVLRFMGSAPHWFVFLPTTVGVGARARRDRTNELDQLEDRARPSVRDDQRPPPARLVELVREASDLVACRTLAAAGALGHHSFAREGRCYIGARHGCILV